MAKGFKLRFSKVITTFQSCRSKDPSTLPHDPVHSFFQLSPVNTKRIAIDFSHIPLPSKPRPYCSSFKRHVSSTIISVGCRLTSKPDATKPSHHEGTGSQHFKWQREEKWHVVAKIYDDTPRRKIYNTSASGDSDDDISILAPPPPPLTAEERKRRPKKKKMASRHRMSTSSADSGWFSSDERAEEETETLVSSSRSFSTDSSSEFNPHLETIREAPISKRHTKSKKKVTKRSKRSVSYPKDKQRTSSSSTENETPARLSMFKKLIPCSVEGKVKESFAIVKKSEDPYEDFKRSMMEMILEKQMFEKEDLEQLLQCFLSLNSRCYHGVIIQAFSDIWKALFSASSTHQCRVSKGPLRTMKS